MTVVPARLKSYILVCARCFRLICIVGAVGCGAAVDSGGSLVSAERTEQESRADSGAAAVSEWAEMYGGPAQDVQLGDLESSVLEEVGRLPCELDDRLIAAARHHAEALLLSPGAVDSGEMDQLRFTLHRFGVYAYGIESAVVTLDPASRRFLASLVHDSGHKWARCGIGTATVGGRSLAVWVAARPTPKIAPFPSHVRPGESFRLRIHGGRGKSERPQLYIGNPDTTVTRKPPTRRAGDGGVEFAVYFEKAGRYELELLCDTGHGPETVMLVPVFAGVPPDTRPVVAKEPGDAAEADPEKTLLRLLNGARKRVGLGPLVRDRRLDKVAKSHSSDMADAGYFGHVSPRFGSAAQRLAAAGLSPARSGENIAGAATPFRVHRNLMASPAHRINMLNPAFTHVGIGTSETNGLILGTEVYAAW